MISYQYDFNKQEECYENSGAEKESKRERRYDG